MADFRHKGETYDVAILLLWKEGKRQSPAKSHLPPAALRDRMFDFNLTVLGGMADDAHAPAPVRTPPEELAIAMA